MAAHRAWPIALSAMLGLAAVVLLVIFISRQGTAPNLEPPAAPAPDVTAAAPDAPDAVTSQDAEDAAARAADASARAAVASARPSMLQGQELERWRLRYWLAEDEVYNAAPRYADVRKEYLAKARELLAAGQTSADILSLAQDELDRFWDAGGLSSPAAYERGYLAWAVMEVACEREPEDFALLCGLAEAANALTIALDADAGKYRKEAFDVLWPIARKQHDLVVSGKAPRSIDAVTAMCDWTNMCSVQAMFDGLPRERWAQAQVSGCEWLVSNAEGYGCAGLLPDLRVRLQMMRDGKPCALVCLVPSLDQQTEEGRLLWVRHFRRMLSLRGSRRYREQLVKQWEFGQPAQ